MHLLSPWVQPSIWYEGISVRLTSDGPGGGKDAHHSDLLMFLGKDAILCHSEYTVRGAELLPGRAD